MRQWQPVCVSLCLCLTGYFCCSCICIHTVQVVFTEASSAAGHTIDRVISIMDANGLTLSALTGFAQRVSEGVCASRGGGEGRDGR